MTTTEIPPLDDAGAAGIDPRIRARRIAVRRGEGRKRLRRLARLTGLLAAVLAGWLVTRSPVLDVDHIDVRGAEHAAVDAIRSASGIATGDPMTDVETRAAADGVEALPWVASARVRRGWPNRIMITVTERTAVAAVAAAGTWWAVDGEGRLLEQVLDAGGGVAILGVEAGDAGPLAPGAQLRGVASTAVRVATMLPAAVRAVTVAVEVSAGEVALRLAGEGTVRLGRPDAVADKLLAAATVLGDVDPACVATLDVRVPSAPVLTRGRQCG